MDARNDFEGCMASMVNLVWVVFLLCASISFIIRGVWNFDCEQFAAGLFGVAIIVYMDKNT